MFKTVYLSYEDTADLAIALGDLLAARRRRARQLEAKAAPRAAIDEALGDVDQLVRLIERINDAPFAPIGGTR